MSSAWWYGLVTLIFSVVGAYVWWKRPDKKLLAVYALMSGLTYAAEFFVLVLFRAYTYHPHVLQDEYFDGLVGSIVSNAFSVPIGSVLVAAFQCGWGRMLLLAGIIVGLEAFFVHLGIYEHHWWRLIYTGAGLMAWFAHAKVIYRQLSTRVTAWLRWRVLFCANLLVQASAVFVLTAFFHAYRYEIGWFAEKTRDHVAFATVYVFLLSAIFASLVAFGVRWRWRMAVILLLVPVNWLLKEHGILHLSGHWSLMHFAVLRLAFLAVIDAFNRFVL